MNVLNKLNLRPKLFILSLVPLLITAVYAGFQFQHEVAGIGEHEVERIRSDLTEARRQELKQYLDIVQSLIAPYYSGDKADDPKAEEKAAELLRRLRYGKDGYVFVYRYDGTNLVYGPKPEVEGKNLWDVSDADGNKVIQDLIGIAKSGNGYYTYQWNKPSKGKAVPKLSYTVGLDKWQWMVGTGFYIDDIDDRIAEVGLQIDDHLNDTLINLGAAFAIALGLTAVFAYFTSCAITRPMCGTARAMKNIAEGDGDLTLRLPVNSTDEVGRLATAFNAFADRMHQAMRQVDTVAGNIASSSDGLYQSTRENSERVNQQRSQTTQIAAAIQEMTSTVQEVAKSAEQAATSAADARSNTEQGQQVISDSVSRIRDLAQGIDHAGETVDALAGESNNIGVVLDVIRGIAEQTNLLALNAAIEAARAGEHGRGFAVVADEVRTLASRTQESTHEIQEMVERLAQGAGKAVKVMQDSKEKVQNTASMAEKAESSLEAIRSTVGVIDDMNAQIATAAEEQGVVAGEINGNVNAIAEFSHATASASEQVNNASHELSRMGGELRQLVSQFKV